MIALLLVSLFTAAALLALCVTAHSFWRYGEAALAIHARLESCSDLRDVRYTIRTVARPGYGRVIRADFTPGAGSRRMPARRAA